jgi:cytochrome c oxidase cbb3-type subunit 1
MGQLTSGERQLGVVVLVVLAIIGIAMAAGGRFDPIGIHGVLVLVYSLALLYVLFSQAFGPEPDASRFASYYDDPIKVGIGLTLVWAVFGMFMGVWAAAQLAWPSLNFDTAWSSFGRIRPHTPSGVIFGFGGNA